MCVFAKVIAEFELREGPRRRGVAWTHASNPVPQGRGKPPRDWPAWVERCREILGFYAELLPDVFEDLVGPRRGIDAEAVGFVDEHDPNRARLQHPGKGSLPIADG